MRETYQGRADAGRRLAARLAGTHGEDVVVLGLPRGGVLVAAEAAAALGAPPDVIVVRKLGVSFQPDLAMGAIGEGGARVLDQDLIARPGISPSQIEAVGACYRDFGRTSDTDVVETLNAALERPKGAGR